MYCGSTYYVSDFLITVLQVALQFKTKQITRNKSKTIPINHRLGIKYGG